MYEIMDVDKNFCECYCCESLSFMSERGKKKGSKAGENYFNLNNTFGNYVYSCWDQEGISFARQGRPGDFSSSESLTPQ